MARRVFFSFHYDDVWRVNVVRNSDIVTKQYEASSRAGFIDKSLWEKVKKEGDLAIKRMINKGLDGSAVTCVLIGKDTWQRPWVRYEILKSFQRRNGVFGVQIHGIASNRPNPFAALVQPQTSMLGGLGRGLLSGTPQRTGALLTGALSIPSNPERNLSPLARAFLDVQARTDPPGPNPFDYLGFRIDPVWEKAAACEYTLGTWVDREGIDPLYLNGQPYGLTKYSSNAKLSNLFPIYDWTTGTGHKNIGTWIEAAARHAGR